MPTEFVSSSKWTVKNSRSAGQTCGYLFGGMHYVD